MQEKIIYRGREYPIVNESRIIGCKDLNLKARYIICEYCIYAVQTTLAGVTCLHCSSNLITVIGNDELA
jgi:copper chaperone CopZ